MDPGAGRSRAASLRRLSRRAARASSERAPPAVGASPQTLPEAASPPSSSRRSAHARASTARSRRPSKGGNFQMGGRRKDLHHEARNLDHEAVPLTEALYPPGAPSPAPPSLHPPRSAS